MGVFDPDHMTPGGLMTTPLLPYPNRHIPLPHSEGEPNAAP